MKRRNIVKELDIFIQSKETFKNFPLKFSILFCLNLEIYEKDNRLKCRYYSLDIETILYNNHGMLDDMGIKFTEYNYCLSLIKINRGGTGKEYDDLYYSLAKYYAVKIADELDCKCMVVENLQRILLETCN